MAKKKRKRKRKNKKDLLKTEVQIIPGRLTFIFVGLAVAFHPEIVLLNR